MNMAKEAKAEVRVEARKGTRANKASREKAATANHQEKVVNRPEGAAATVRQEKSTLRMTMVAARRMKGRST